MPPAKPRPQPSATRAIELLTTADAADELQVSEKTIRRWINDGDLHVHRLGRAIRIARDDLTAFVTARRR